MKIVEKNKKQNKKENSKKTQPVHTKKQHVLIVAQEIKFARLLSANEQKTRDRALKSLKKWLLNCFHKDYDFKEDDFNRIWKGLFYAVWMSDKALVQEELCENIASILDLFPPDKIRYAIMMVKVGLQVLASEWYGIDQHRMDKCLMLVRRYLRGSFRCLLRCDWSQESCTLYTKILTNKDGILATEPPLYARNATSMILHFMDCYLEELAKVSDGVIPLESVGELLRPYCAYVCVGSVPTLCAGARRVLAALLRQSAPGMRYQHATEAWRKMGCPEGGPEALELVSDDEGDDGSDDDADDSSPKALDPRAGRVDVLLPILPVPSVQLASMLRQLAARAKPKAQRRARIYLDRFEQLTRDIYPLPETAPAPERSHPARRPAPAAASLLALEKKLVVASDELALRGLSRKHRKRLLAKSRAGISIVEELETVNEVSTNSANGDWHVEDAEPKRKKKKTTGNIANKENVNDKIHEKKRKLIQNGDMKPQNGGPKLKKKVTLDKATVIENIIDNSLKKEHAKKETKKSIPKIPNGTTKSTQAIKEKNKSQNQRDTTKKDNKSDKIEIKLRVKSPTVVANKLRNFQKQVSPKIDKLAEKKASLHTPKKVKFVLKNNSMQGPIDYYKSVRQSPNIPYDGTKRPSKTNLKPFAPSPINPFFKKKLRLKK